MTVALNLMHQPIRLDADGAAVVTSLLGSGDRDTRQNAAEFLMKLDDPESVTRAFDAVRAVVVKRDDANAVYNAVIVMGTWMRILPEDLTRDGRPLWKEVGTTLRAARAELERDTAKHWDRTIAAIDELLKNARESKRRAAA